MKTLVLWRKVLWRKVLWMKTLFDLLTLPPPFLEPFLEPFLKPFLSLPHQDIFPGSRGSDPQWLIALGEGGEGGGTLFFVADGVDTTWMDFTDACNGYRKSTLRIVESDAKGTRTSTQQPGTVVVVVGGRC